MSSPELEAYRVKLQGGFISCGIQAWAALGWFWSIGMFVRSHTGYELTGVNSQHLPRKLEPSSNSSVTVCKLQAISEHYG